MLSNTDKIEYYIREMKSEIGIEYGFILGLYAFVGAAIIAKYNFEATIKLLVYGIIIPVIWLFFTMIVNSWTSNKIDKEFTERALNGNKDNN